MPFILPFTSVSKGGGGHGPAAAANGHADAAPATWLQEVWEDSGDDGDGRSLARFKKQFVAKVVGSFIL